MRVVRVVVARRCLNDCPVSVSGLRWEPELIRAGAGHWKWRWRWRWSWSWSWSWGESGSALQVDKQVEGEEEEGGKQKRCGGSGWDLTRGHRYHSPGPPLLLLLLLLFVWQVGRLAGYSRGKVVCLRGGPAQKYVDMRWGGRKEPDKYSGQGTVFILAITAAHAMDHLHTCKKGRGGCAEIDE